MKRPSIPTLTLPTSGYREMVAMSNRRLVCLLRTAVLSSSGAGRFSPRPPADHDAYVVHHQPGCISIRLYADGEEVFRCQFIPPSDY